VMSSCLLAFQREFAARLGHWRLPYPDIST
jgi:hypothetical protein